MRVSRARRGSGGGGGRRGRSRLAGLDSGSGTPPPAGRVFSSGSLMWWNVKFGGPSVLGVEATDLVGPCWVRAW